MPVAAPAGSHDDVGSMVVAPPVTSSGIESLPATPPTVHPGEPTRTPAPSAAPDLQSSLASAVVVAIGASMLYVRSVARERDRADVVLERVEATSNNRARGGAVAIEQRNSLILAVLRKASIKALDNVDLPLVAGGETTCLLPMADSPRGPNDLSS